MTGRMQIYRNEYIHPHRNGGPFPKYTSTSSILSNSIPTKGCVVEKRRTSLGMIILKRTSSSGMKLDPPSISDFAVGVGTSVTPFEKKKKPTNNWTDCGTAERKKKIRLIDPDLGFLSESFFDDHHEMPTWRDNSIATWGKNESLFNGY